VNAHERISAVLPDREKTEQTTDYRVSVTVRSGREMTSWERGTSIALRMEARIEFPPISSAGWPNGGATLAEVVSSYMALSRATYLGIGSQAARPIYLIEGEPAECAGSNGGLIELAVDIETLFVLRHAVYDIETGDLVQLHEVQSIEYNPALADSVFEPPAGVTVAVFGDGRMTTVSGDHWFGSDSESDCY
jgi:outer membrane lipoprotein-sorting protein